jgi:hypothetical protein
MAALLLASLAVGPFSFRAERPLVWPLLAAAYFALYLSMARWTSRSLEKLREGGSRLLWRSTTPFLVLFAVGLVAVQIKPDLVGKFWFLTSPIQPFPLLAASLLLLLVFLLKSAVVAWSRRSIVDRQRTHEVAARSAVPAAMLLLGLLQATAYILPIGNASLRFWAIADGIFAGNGYPLTLTEPGPISAGSPPYVYDLPLFPLLIKAAFGLLGHNSAAVHLPGAISSALFPLSLYLLMKQATRSKVTAVVFASLASLFPFLRSWVLNLPDPDPFFLTSLCFAAYFYLRALDARQSAALWTIAGIASGVASLARPEGVLYVAFFGLGILACRPRLKQLALYVIAVGLFVGPMTVVWLANFGFLWPQNYNRTLDLSHPLMTYRQLDTQGGLPLYYQGLGIGAEWGVAILALFVVSSLLGTVAMLFRDRRLLAIAIPATGNTAMIFFTNPWISNAFHYADFFRHASFGIPFMVVASAYGFQTASRYLLARSKWRLVPYLCLLLLTAAVIREGDILANPTATHRPGSPLASQVLTDNAYLSMQTILEHPMPLPTMNFYRDGNNMLVGYPTGLPWPETAVQFFKPLDMSYDRQGAAFGYASVLAFLMALAFAVMAELSPISHQLSVISYQPPVAGSLSSARSEGEREGIELA